MNLDTGESWTISGFVTLLVAAFTRLVYVRRKNSDAVMDAVDSTSTVYVSNLIANWQAAEKLAKTNNELYMIEKVARAQSEAEVRGLKADLLELKAEVKRLTLLVIRLRPEFAEILHRTNFGDLGP